MKLVATALEWRDLRAARLERQRIEKEKALKRSPLNKVKLKFELMNDQKIKSQIRAYRKRSREKAQQRAERASRG